MEAFRPARWFTLLPWLAAVVLSVFVLAMWRSDLARLAENRDLALKQQQGELAARAALLKSELGRRAAMLQSLVPLLNGPDLSLVAQSTDVLRPLWPQATLVTVSRTQVPARWSAKSLLGPSSASVLAELLESEQPCSADVLGARDEIYLARSQPVDGGCQMWLLPLSPLLAELTDDTLAWSVTAPGTSLLGGSRQAQGALERVDKQPAIGRAKSPERLFLTESQSLGEYPVKIVLAQEISPHSIQSHQRKPVFWLLLWALSLLIIALLWLWFRSRIDAMARTFQSSVAQERDHLAEATRRLQMALENSQSGYWDWDLLSDTVYYSDHWKKMLGVDPQVSIRDSVTEWTRRVHPDDRQSCLDQLTAHLKGHTGMFENEHRLCDENGRYVWFLTRGRVTERDEQHRARQMIGVYTRIDERKRINELALRQQQALSQLNEIASLPGTQANEMLRRGLALGAEYLGLPLAIISQIEGDVYTVRVQFSPPDTLSDGQVFNLPECFCVETLKAGDVLAIHHTADSELATHPCYLSTKLETYIGAPVWVNDEVYGTLNFSSPQQRLEPFTESERNFVRVMARWVGATLERWYQERENRELTRTFTKLSDSVPGCVCQFQLNPDGSSFFPYASQGIVDVYGVTPEQVAESADFVFNHIHPDDLERVRRGIETSAAQLTLWADSYRVNHPDKGLIWVRGQTSPEQLAEGGVIWHGFIWDVTEEVHAEQELRFSNRWRKAILDAASVSFIAADCDGMIRTFNRGAEQLLGYTAAEIIDKQTPAIFHLPEEVSERAEVLTQELGRPVEAGFEAFVAKAVEGYVDENEWTYVRKDGSRVKVILTVTAVRDERGRLEGYLGVARDISLLRAQEEKIRVASERTQTILDNAADGIIAISEDGLIETFNQAAESIFGWKADDILGQSVNVLMPPAEAAQHDFYLHRFRTERVNRMLGVSRELYGVRKNGEQFPIEISLSEIIQEGRSLFIAMARDITERKRIDRMKSEFIATVSHELRTPLTAISGALRLLDSGTLGSLPEQWAKLVHIAYANSSRLIHLVNDLLDMEKLVAGKMNFALQYQPLLPLVQRCVESNRSLCSEHNVEFALDDSALKFQAQARPVLVQVDGHRFEQVMANLLSNAAKFTRRDAEVVIKLEWESRLARVTVIDRGPGIPAEFRERIFQKFSQADSSSTKAQRGTGLGLAISKEIVERLGGHIGFDSREGEGSSFFFTLPACLGSRFAFEGLPNKPRVLHVEDDEAISGLVAALLQDSVELVLAGSLEQARQTLSQESFDIVILDVLLPDGNGLELVDLLNHSGHSHIDILAISQVALMAEQRRGISAVLEKNEHLPQTLVAWMDRWLDSRLDHEQESP